MKIKRILNDWWIVAIVLITAIAYLGTYNLLETLLIAAPPAVVIVYTTQITPIIRNRKKGKHRE